MRQTESLCTHLGAGEAHGFVSVGGLIVLRGPADGVRGAAGDPGNLRGELLGFKNQIKFHLLWTTYLN